jgi:AAA domain
MIERRAATEVAALLEQLPAVVLVGPRQAGKTTLALELANTRPATYLDLESMADRARLAEPELYFADHSGGGEWPVEIKRSLAPTVERGFHSALADLRPERALVVYPGQERYRIGPSIEAIDVAGACELARAVDGG